MSRLVFLLLVACSTMSLVLAAPAYIDDTSDNNMAHYISVEDLNKLASAARDLESISTMVQRRKRSLSSILMQLMKKMNKSTTPSYSMF